MSNNSNTTTTTTLYWISADRQSSLSMGECAELTDVAVEAARAEMRDQLGSDDDGEWIDEGSFELR